MAAARGHLSSPTPRAPRTLARNLRCGVVSGRTVTGSRPLAAFAAALALASGVASAQRERAPFTGYELALTGSPVMMPGRTARLRGSTYRVRGLAELVPAALPVRARFDAAPSSDPAWVSARSDASGAFVIEVPIPDRAPGEEPRLELEVGSGDDARRFEIPAGVASPYEILLRTDRRLYEPGEPVHVWALVRDARSGRPVVGRRFDVALEGGPVPETDRALTTGPSGALELVVPLSSAAPAGHVQVSIDDGVVSTATTSFRVGTRTWERVMATLEVEPREVAPHARAVARLSVTTPSGAPVTGARVELTVDGSSNYTGTTGADGRAEIEIRAPAYLVHETGVVSVRAQITHPAHGSVEAFGTMRLAVPLALSIELVPRHGALVPELDDVLFVRLRDGAGDPPPAGTELEVEGPGVTNGRARTDENGLAEVPLRLPLGAASSQGGEPRASYGVRVRGPLERVAFLPVDVAREPEVVPTFARPILAPGDRVEVTLSRRPSAAARTLVVELIDDGGELLAVHRVASREGRVSVTLPADRVGLLSVRARAVHEDESHEGMGGYDRVIVRPPSPAFVRVEPERPRWTVGETARVSLVTPAGGPRGFAAVLVRDLAAHGGEQPFRRTFLEDAFDRAVLDPSGPSGERLVRAALAAAHVPADTAPVEAAPLVDELGLPEEADEPQAASPERGVLRDPWPLARELARRGVGPAMAAFEERLEEALASGGLDELTEGRGGQRRFADTPLDDLETLGGGPITASILTRSDPSFTYEAVARRVARARLVRLMVVLARYLDPGEDATPEARMAAREPSARWLPRMVERGMIDGHDLDDPWGGRFVLREVAAPLFALSPQAARLELVSPGPDGRAGTRDDVRDPFERVVPASTPYAVASGEDALMRKLAILSPAERTLAAIAEAYTRTNAEMAEEEIGDAVTARVSEGVIGLGSLGTVGHGAGGGGSGYGYGAGGMRGRTARSPSIRVGSAAVSGLARVVRERFPPTLLFRPSIELDPSGTTPIEIPLADAVTTYLVEAIVWREDGWIWSHHARIEVDRDVVIDAPVPDVARVGDRVRLPLRVSNRGDRPRELRVSMLEEPALGIAASAPAAITLEPGGARVVPVDVPLSRAGSGHVSVVVTDPSGTALDAVRRPLRVVTAARRVHVERDALVSGDGSVTLEVPEGADPRRGRVRVAVGLAMVPAPFSTPWLDWAPGGRFSGEEDGDAVRRAFLLGADWRRPRRMGAGRTRSRLAQLTAQLESLGADDSVPGRATRARALCLLGLSPMASARAPLPEAVALMDRLAREISSEAASATDDPETWVVAAAALGWSSRGAAYRDRVAELARRLERHTVVVGEDRWLPTADAPLRSTALLAMAELSLGRRERAFVLVRTLARWSSLGHALPDDARAFARAVADRLMGRRALERVTLVIDGAREEVELVDGAAELDREALAAGGRHVVRAVAPNGAPLWLRVDADYGVPWTERPTRAGPLSLRYEGEVGGEDELSELELVVKNRSPRTLPAPIVEIDLPTGAELTERDRAQMGWVVRSVHRSDGVLTLRLAPLRPGNEVRVRLPVRWSVAGRLVGLGAAAFVEDRPEEITVLAPRELEIAPRGEVSR